MYHRENPIFEAVQLNPSYLQMSHGTGSWLFASNRKRVARMSGPITSGTSFVAVQMSFGVLFAVIRLEMYQSHRIPKWEQLCFFPSTLYHQDVFAGNVDNGADIRP